MGRLSSELGVEFGRLSLRVVLSMGPEAAPTALLALDDPNYVDGTEGNGLRGRFQRRLPILGGLVPRGIVRDDFKVIDYNTHGGLANAVRGL
jgi:hypothetical protein